MVLLTVPRRGKLQHDEKVIMFQTVASLDNSVHVVLLRNAVFDRLMVSTHCYQLVMKQEVSNYHICICRY